MPGNDRDEEGTSLPDVADLRRWCGELGLRPVGVVGIGLGDDNPHPEATERRRQALAHWVEAGYHGQMAYMARDIVQRADPAVLLQGARSVVMVALDYAQPGASDWRIRDWRQLRRPGAAYISNYARGRDYHKLLRRRLQRLADRMVAAGRPFGYRAFVDSAPIMEVPLAEAAGLGWRGKHTLLLNRTQGSMFFLGALATDLPLAAGAFESQAASQESHCGSCRRCIDVCPTQAILAPGQLDARRCISYLTIELKEAIPEALRPLIGNRIYGCDDCQLVCPWNRFAHAGDPDFAPRHGLDRADLSTLFAWTPSEFDERTQGSPIRRIGHERWLRNIAVALGNVADTGADAAVRTEAVAALGSRQFHPSALVREHVAWALDRLN